MRGKVPCAGFRSLQIGITPAYAGKSAAQRHLVAASVGSPPPMRGKEQLKNRGRIAKRITPAYAGKRLEIP